jgi:hypothetical protein
MRSNKRDKRGRAEFDRLQHGGNSHIEPAFVGDPWSSSANAMGGESNHYELNPEGSGSGDPLNILLNTRNVQPTMRGGAGSRRRRRNAGAGSRRRRRKLNIQRGGLGAFAQDAVNVARSSSTNLGNVIRGGIGQPQQMSPDPTAQPIESPSTLPRYSIM